MSASAVPFAYSKDRPFLAKITESRLLNKPGSAKETRHFVIDLRGSGLRYKSGDSLGIFPSNRQSEVDEILRHLEASGNELVAPAMLKLAVPIALREALAQTGTNPVTFGSNGTTCLLYTSPSPRD